MSGTVINTGVVTTPGDTNPGNNTSTVKTPVVAVLPIHIVKPPHTLPFTGSDSESLILVALALLGMGGLMVLATRRRRTA